MSSIRDSGTTPEVTSQPELVFGNAAAMGVDLAAIHVSLATALRAVRYETEMIQLTTEMLEYDVPNKPPTVRRAVLKPDLREAGNRRAAAKSAAPRG